MSKASHRIRKEFRYAIMPGYPQAVPFKSINQVREYMAGSPDGSRIICLLCGKSYKTLGVHLLAIHNVSPDEYREKYNIPYTYKLSSPVTSKKHSAISKEMHINGIIKIPNADIITKMQKSQKRLPALKNEICMLNLPKPTHGRKSKAYMEVHTTKRGTPEYHEKMRSRPQTKNFNSLWWKGKKQTADHIAKRVAKGLETRKKRKARINPQCSQDHQGTTASDIREATE